MSIPLPLSIIWLAGGMAGADIGLGWIDQKGQLHFEVSIKLLSISVHSYMHVYIGSICIRLCPTSDG